MTAANGASDQLHSLFTAVEAAGAGGAAMALAAAAAAAGASSPFKPAEGTRAWDSLAQAAGAAAAEAAGLGARPDAVDDDGTDDMDDDEAAAGEAGERRRRPAASGHGQRNSGSHSTLDPSEWRGGDDQLDHMHQYGGGNTWTSLPTSQHVGGGSGGSGGDGALPQQRGRRNARQQEQNKQAQQRYRAKRKAQFEELQRKVQLLSHEVADAQRQRVENQRLQDEVGKLKVLLQAASSAIPGATAAVTAAAAGPSTATGTGTAAGRQGPLARPDSSASLPGLLPYQHKQQAPAALQQAGGSGSQAINHPSSLLGGVSGGLSGAFKPTGVAAAVQRAAPSSPTTAATTTGAGALASTPAVLTSSSTSMPMLPTKQIHAALNLYYQELQAFATSVQLERLPVDGAGLGAEAARKLAQLVHAGIELVKMVLQASGPDAAALLTGNLPTVGVDGVSPADSLKQWQMVAARVALTPSQRLLLADWRSRFLQKIDDCYGRRLLSKAQLAQMPSSGLGGPAAQWVEALLLQAAESVGYSACALACAQLDGVVASLQDNVREERTTACSMMSELLDRILTKVQSARFLLAGHPFCWNGLSFAHAVAAMQQPQMAVAQPTKDSLSGLLAQLG